MCSHPLRVRKRHIGISIPARWELLQDLVQRSHILLVEVRWRRILLDTVGGSCSWDGNDGSQPLPPAKSEHPPRRNLSWLDTLPLGNLIHCTSKLQVLVECIGLEAGEVPENGVFRKIVIRFELTSLRVVNTKYV
jgi:hypothetical protein